MKENPVKITTKDLKHSLTLEILRVSSQIAAEPCSLSLSTPSHIQIPQMLYKLNAKHVRSQEGHTSVDTGVEPQPGFAHSYRHLAQAAEHQEAVPESRYTFFGYLWSSGWEPLLHPYICT